MEKNHILCPHCGQRLARLLGGNGQRQRIQKLEGASVHTGKNSLGEEMAWIRCPKCRADKSFNPAFWDAGS